MTPYDHKYARVVNETAAEIGLSGEELRSGRSNERLRNGRLVAAVRLRAMGLSHTDIGWYLGGRNHSTICGLLAAERKKETPQYKIKLEACSDHGISVKELMSKRSDRHAVNARRLAARRMRDELQMSYTEIGNELRRDHSSIIHLLTNSPERRLADKVRKGLLPEAPVAT